MYNEQSKREREISMSMSLLIFASHFIFLSDLSITTLKSKIVVTSVPVTIEVGRL